MKRQSRVKAIAGSVLFLVGITAIQLIGGGRALAACAAPGTDYGSATRTISIPSTATYRIWSRMMVPNGTDKTFLLEVDGGNCYTVGGGSITANSWTWIDYQSGNTNSKVQQTLSAGNHTIKLIGNAPDVKVDRVIAVSNLSCPPTGFGDNCNVPDDTTVPTVTLTAPTEGATVSGTVAVTATATDNIGVTKVEFYDNSSLLGTDTSSPYSANFDSTKVPNGTHLLTARAYDAAGNISADSNSVTTKNGDSQAPSQPSNVKASATSYNSAAVSWTASSDNVGVTSYTIYRDNVPVDSVGAVTSYAAKGLSANTTYGFQVQAVDAAGNKSAVSAQAKVTTSTVPDTQTPTKPTGLTATVISQTQINLSWTASTDNIGITSYDIYRATGSDAAQKVGTSTTTSFGDPNLTANTTYTYYVVAKDASGNASANSDTVSAKTQAEEQTPTVAFSNITGTIKDGSTQKIIPYARVVLVAGGHRHTYQADRFGRYAIFRLATGKYNLSYSARGYYAKTMAIDLTATKLVQDVTLDKK